MAFLAAWNMALLPLTAWKVTALGAALKAGRYRSYAAYLSVAKQEAERVAEAPLPPSVGLALRDAARSCARGLGAPAKAEGLPLELLGGLPEPDVRAGAGGPCGPVGPKALLVLGCWWGSPLRCTGT